MYNCGVVLETNALVVLGFKVFHSNGTEVPAQGGPGEPQPSVSVTSVSRVCYYYYKEWTCYKETCTILLNPLPGVLRFEGGGKCRIRRNMTPV